METEDHVRITRKGRRTARPAAVTATLAALLRPAVSITGQTAAGADHPAVPQGLVIPLVAAGLLLWRANRWSAGAALAVGLFLGTGALVTPDTGDHLSPGGSPLVVSTGARLAALAGLVVSAAMAMRRAGARK